MKIPRTLGSRSFIDTSYIIICSTINSNTIAKCLFSISSTNIYYCLLSFTTFNYRNNKKIFKYEIYKIIIRFVYYRFNYTWGGVYIQKSIQRIPSFSYINQVPLEINKILPEGASIALTEAGKVAYWNQKGNHKIIDLVGLNTEYPAKNTISIQYLEELSPDMMMYHQVGQLDTNLFATANENVILLENADKKFFNNKKEYTNKERKLLAKTINASIISTEYLQHYFDKYDIFLVFFYQNELNQTYSHVYAFKKRLQIKDKIYKILEESFNEKTKMSFFEMLEKVKKH